MAGRKIASSGSVEDDDPYTSKTPSNWCAFDNCIRRSEEVRVVFSTTGFMFYSLSAEPQHYTEEEDGDEKTIDDADVFSLSVDQ